MKFNKADQTVRFFIFMAFTGALMGCLGPRKIDKWVAREYGDIPAPPKKSSDYLTVVSGLGEGVGDRISTTEKKTSKVLPLLFYWQFDYKNTCTLNPRIPVSNFTTTVMSYAGAKLKQKLNGRRVELRIEKIPNSFSIDDKGHLIWVVLYAFDWEYLSIQPGENQIEVSYRVLNGDGTEDKKGLISVPSADRGVALRMFQSLKKKTWEYLDQFNANISTISKRVVDELIKEI